MIVVITLCYNNHEVLEKSIDRYYQLCSSKPDIHFLVDNEYPLHKEKYKETLKKLSIKYGCHVLQPYQNLGMKDGCLWAIDQLALYDNDKIIFYDSNAYPDTLNFDKALLDVLDDESIGASCLTKKDINLESLTDFSGRYKFYNDVNVNERNFFNSSIGCFPFYLHKKIKFQINLFSKNYGDIVNEKDSIVKRMVKDMNKKIVFLTDYNESNFYFSRNGYEDKDYSIYKKILLSKKNYLDFSFENYLLNKDKYNNLSHINYHIFKVNGGVF